MSGVAPSPSGVLILAPAESRADTSAQLPPSAARTNVDIGRDTTGRKHCLRERERGRKRRGQR